MLDSVTLFGYNLGTVKNCESGWTSPQGMRPDFVWMFEWSAGVGSEADKTQAARGNGATKTQAKAKAKRKAAGGTRKLTLIGGDNPRMQKPRKNAWSKAKAKEFLGVLADTCNVSEACRQSGISVGAAYKRRGGDAAFRAGWMEAISVAYQRLELVLLDRAFNGTEKLVKRRDGSTEVMLEYSNTLGLALLKQPPRQRGRSGHDVRAR